ncbi:hypothetical protein H5410_060597 [Solanum commersonii]|uniref:Uncharacterized protein n=1 Tax=Solanum commersonii TaxID=4109 RepID=A0A9J5W642_SOLCO|nr:hypothetical protein H5410_060597 [Solanum commersonii]
MKTIWWKLKKVKSVLKELNNSELRWQLQQVQTDMIDHNMVHANKEQERESRQQLEIWSLVEKSVIRQKSRRSAVQLAAPATKREVEAALQDISEWTKCCGF